MTQKEAQPEAVALFVSDVHLHPAMPHTVQAFLRFLRQDAPGARRLYLLGDLFEYWAGDDDLATPLNQHIAQAISQLNESSVEVYWIGGNRDFLLGEGFAEVAGLTLLPDPCVIDVAGHRIVLTHGDAQCTDDHAYLAFRRTVRNPKWQEEFLAQPLAQRKALIEGMRVGSREAQRSKSMEIMDVNNDAIAALFEQSRANVMIHGHTHRPASHVSCVNGIGRKRYVLPDWDCDGGSARGGWVALYADGSFKRFRFDGREE